MTNKPTISPMGTGYLKAYMGNTWTQNRITGERRQHPEFIYAPNLSELNSRIDAWKKSQRNGRNG